MKKQHLKTLSIMEAMALFTTEKRAVERLEKARWGDKLVCPHCELCEGISTSESKAFTYWGKHCWHHFTAQIGALIREGREYGVFMLAGFVGGDERSLFRAMVGQRLRYRGLLA